MQWRNEIRDVLTDPIGNWLLLREWFRVRQCNLHLFQAFPGTRKFSVFLPSQWSRPRPYQIVLPWTREEHLAYDPWFVDTVEYLPVGTYIWFTSDTAPPEIPARGWSWVQYRLPYDVEEKTGWVHPKTIGGNGLMHF